MNSELSQPWLILSLKIYKKPNAMPLLILKGEHHVWKYQKFDKQECKKQVQLEVTSVTSKNKRYNIHTIKLNVEQLIQEIRSRSKSSIEQVQI